MTLIRGFTVLWGMALAAGLPSPSAVKSTGFGNICKPNLCKGSFAECNGSKMTLQPYPVNISSWDNETKTYTQVGKVATPRQPPPNSPSRLPLLSTAGVLEYCSLCERYMAHGGRLRGCWAALGHGGKSVCSRRLTGVL